MVNLLTPEQKKGIKLYKGYFLYYILDASHKGKKILKSYNFSGYSKKLVTRFRAQFSNPLSYDFKGEMVVRAREQEKMD